MLERRNAGVQPEQPGSQPPAARPAGGVPTGFLQTGVSESISPVVALDWAWSAHSSGPNPDPCGRYQAFGPPAAAGVC